MFMRTNTFFKKLGSRRNGGQRIWVPQMTQVEHVGQAEGSAALAEPVLAPQAPEPRTHGFNLVPADLRLPGPLYLRLKRVFDIVVALMALAVFGLFLPILALVIKLDSPGPVFYSQERVGLNRRQRIRRTVERASKDRRKVLRPGKPFKVHKLRSMRTDAEAKGAQWATKNDSRITRVGNFLRKTRLDEVPQFLNVLKGEMSLIGPRPERLVFVHQLEKDIPDFRDRLLVKPGITGLAQVINGYDDGVESARRKVELDKRYINNSGWRQDVKILLSTVGVVLKGEGAH
jgi:lipopolysaccharide/colanic/teichoic acid biosynthesis glycosyltransferase